MNDAKEESEKLIKLRAKLKKRLEKVTVSEQDERIKKATDAVHARIARLNTLRKVVPKEDTMSLFAEGKGIKAPSKEIDKLFKRLQDQG